MPRAVVGVVEPDQDLRRALEEHLAAGGYKARAFSNFSSFEVYSGDAANYFDLVILSAELKDASVESALERVQGAGADMIFLGNPTGKPNELSRVMELIRRGVADYLIRPIDGITLLASVNRVLKMRELHRRVSRLKHHVENLTGGESSLIGDSKELSSIRTEIDRVAASSLPVLILGETGTGKELIAREIHRRSRREGEFVAINSASLGENLFEAELFGYEPGAFTGAKGRKTGLVEIADNGTLFLDEIAELPAAVQARLLRFLDDGRFRRLGGVREIETDVRIVAATNRKVAPTGIEGVEKFRPDLYFRLNGASIAVPPLRDRRDDIGPLAAHFLTKAAEKNLDRAPALLPDAVAALMNYSWPGNVRELRNFVFRMAFTHADSTELSSQDIAPHIPKERIRAAESRPALPEDFSGHDYHELKRRHIEKFDAVFLKEVLDRNAHNISAAAKELGIDRKTFSAKMKELGIK